MCGIAGIFSKSDSNLGSWIESLSNEIIHRGPDDFGYFGLNNLGKSLFSKNPYDFDNSPFVLAHRRLSIIDLNERSQQPMTDASGQYTITYNGEVYNYQQLREELSKAGYQFKTSSDTEVILNGYAQWGVNVVDKLRGMFGFVILDTKRQQAFFARDHFGIKPLYYSASNERFAFASEIKALLTLPWVKREANLDFVTRFIAIEHVPYNARTFIEDIQQIPPGTYGTLNLQSATYEINLTKFWDSSAAHAQLNLNDAESSEQLKDLLLNSVQMHMASDVTVAANLSGGMDSSAIVMAMNQNWQSDQPIQTFSYIAEDGGEEQWIDLITKASNSQNHPFNLTHQDVCESLDKIVYTQEEPFGSTSIVAQYFLYQHVQKNGIKVVLDGQGADEILAGYHTYLSAYGLDLLLRGKAVQFLKVSKSIAKHNNPSFGLFIKRMAKIFLENLPFLIGKFLKYMPNRYVHKSLFSNLKFKSERSGFSPFKQYFNQMLSVTNLPTLLRFCDRNSMNFSVENRVPFLMPEICDFVSSLPTKNLFSKDIQTKALLRNAMKGIVPDSILNRRDKVAFQTPQSNWLLHASDWVEVNLEYATQNKLNLFNTKQLEKDFKLFLSGKKQLPNSFFRIMSLIAWMRIYRIEI